MARWSSGISDSTLSENFNNTTRLASGSSVWVIIWLSATLWHSYKCHSQKSEIWQFIGALIQVSQCHLYKCHCSLACVQAIGTHPRNMPGVSCIGNPRQALTGFTDISLGLSKGCTKCQGRKDYPVVWSEFYEGVQTDCIRLRQYILLWLTV